MTAHFDRRISFPHFFHRNSPENFSFHLLKILMTFFSHRPQIAVFSLLFSNFPQQNTLFLPYFFLFHSSKILMTFFSHQHWIHLPCHLFPLNPIFAANAPFHHCTFSFITAHGLSTIVQLKSDNDTATEKQTLKNLVDPVSHPAYGKFSSCSCIGLHQTVSAARTKQLRWRPDIHTTFFVFFLSSSTANIASPESNLQPSGALFA